MAIAAVSILFGCLATSSYKLDDLEARFNEINKVIQIEKQKPGVMAPEVIRKWGTYEKFMKAYIDESKSNKSDKYLDIISKSLHIASMISSAIVDERFYAGDGDSMVDDLRFFVGRPAKDRGNDEYLTISVDALLYIYDFEFGNDSPAMMPIGGVRVE